MENPANVSVFMSRPPIAYETSTLPNVRFPPIGDIEAAIARTFGLVSAMGGKRTFAGERCARARTHPGRGSSVIEPHSAAWGRA